MTLRLLGAAILVLCPEATLFSAVLWGPGASDANFAVILITKLQRSPILI